MHREDQILLGLERPQHEDDAAASFTASWRISAGFRKFCRPANNGIKAYALQAIRRRHGNAVILDERRGRTTPRAHSGWKAVKEHSLRTVFEL
jgi:hypothetical protein